MIAYADMKIPVIVGEIVPTVLRIRIEKPQRVYKIGQSPAVDRPARYFVMYFLRIHIRDALRLIGRALELSRRINNVGYGIVPPVFAHALLDTIHDDRRHSLHTLYSFAARFTLNEPRQ